MSRIGKKPIELPKGVEVKQEGNAVTIKGPKGSLSTTLVAGIGLKVEKNVLQFTRGDEEGKSRAFHGLMRALVANNVRGVSEGSPSTRSRATSWSAASTSRRSGRPRPRSARSASPIRTRARGSSIRTK